MLQHLQFKNFKSWVELDMPLAPLTGLFGTNSSGKTSILQFLLMLKQTIENPDESLVLNLDDDKRYVELGTFEEVIHKREVDRELEFGVKVNGDSFLSTVKLIENKTVLTHYGDNIVRNFIIYNKYYDGADEDDRYREVDLQQVEIRYDYDKSEHVGRFQTEEDTFDEYCDTVQFYGFITDSFNYSRFFGYSAFSKIHYLGPLREYPKRTYKWGGAQRSLIGTRGEYVVEALLGRRGSKETIEHDGEAYSLEGYIALWLNKLGIIHDFKITQITGTSIYEAQVQQKASSPWVSLTDVGFGVSQILPVLVLCFFVPKGSILLIEQPEIHLHPSIQSGLADVFIDAIEKRGVQIILESHSEHLLKRLQRRIAEEKFDKAKTALYFCDMDDNGVSHLNSLEMDEFGNIQNWPDNFFGDEMGEIFAASEAMFKRKKAMKDAN